jgi:3-hydroxyacyl-CoA dehydrogenase
VIEAVFEDLPRKQRIFADLDSICDRAAVLASNTSALSIDRIAEATRRPEQVVGLHFFSPAHVMRLVEIVRGSQTDAGVIATAMRLVKSLGKIGVVAGNCDGFIGNRMLAGYRRETEFLLLEGASPAQVDRALCQFGMPMGPLAMGDMAGLDIGAAARRRRRAEGTAPNRDPRFAVISDRLVELGRLGQKTGRVLSLRTRSRDAVRIRTSTASSSANRYASECPRRARSRTARSSSCVYPLINEAARFSTKASRSVLAISTSLGPTATDSSADAADRSGSLELGPPLVLETAALRVDQRAVRKPAS